MKREELLCFLNEYLELEKFKEDTSYNGLQVEGKEEVMKIVGGVTISIELIKEAIKRGADTILVHHGLYWKNVKPIAVGYVAKRVKLLLQNNLNLIAFHIPLDYHNEVGNNVQLLRKLELPVSGDFGTWRGMPVGKFAELKESLERKELIRRITERINPKALIFPFGENKIKKVAVISGGGCESLAEAIEKKMDFFITGEPREWSESVAKDEGINVVFAGHYHTERLGVMALGNLLKEKFGLEFEFVEIEEKI